MESLTQIVYQVATAMLVPVLVTLLAFFGWSLFMLGAFFKEWRQRRLDHPTWQQVLTTNWQEKLLVEGNDDQPIHCSGLRGTFLTLIRCKLKTLPALSEKALADLEIRASGRMAWMSFGVRMGPLLGLMGTLIPMGPALMGLSTGNIEAMAVNLVLVFSTTVVGVFVGGLCFALLLVRRQWYAQDLADIEFLVNQLATQDTRQHTCQNNSETGAEPSREEECCA